MSKRIEYAILYDTSGGEFVPFGIWVIEGGVFDHYYLPGYEEWDERFSGRLDEMDFKKRNPEFWAYWTEQGYNWTMLGPFIEIGEKTGPQFAKEAIADLDAFIKKIKSDRLTPVMDK